MQSGILLYVAFILNMTVKLEVMDLIFFFFTQTTLLHEWTSQVTSSSQLSD